MGYENFGRLLSKEDKNPGFRPGGKGVFEAMSSREMVAGGEKEIGLLCEGGKKEKRNHLGKNLWNTGCLARGKYLPLGGGGGVRGYSFTLGTAIPRRCDYRGLSVQRLSNRILTC